MIRPALLLILGLALAPSRPALAQDAPADAAHGKRLFLLCASCHTLHAGEADKVGPNLYGVIGKAAASRGAFAYSDALKQAGISWTPATLGAWLTQPSALVPGCKMAFAGMPNARDRADIIAYLADATR